MRIKSKLDATILNLTNGGTVRCYPFVCIIKNPNKSEIRISLNRDIRDIEELPNGLLAVAVKGYIHIFNSTTGKEIDCVKRQDISLVKSVTLASQARLETLGVLIRQSARTNPNSFFSQMPVELTSKIMAERAPALKEEQAYKNSVDLLLG
ncbi:hypothetical protein Lgra_1810 [Legionella gratiana]|uniref:Uncharacterized protein n=1 Tax=Legionella gratiana TaxID=45066 RepID=A0A378J8X1_9GAMM|nr:hypothetical protein [Legionella gratiana]KTD10844.1 hypothetical protein Lgra_1810 [Legionella gratiana]STX44045.1 Uncharacterised protein [Legionella gratiana]